MSHHDCDIDQREKIAIGEEKAQQLLADLKKQIWFSEGIMISTCYRSELFAVVRDMNKVKLWWQAHIRKGEEGRYYCYEGVEALRHHLYVALGLDSKIVGESQVFGQYKKAYALAQNVSMGPVLKKLQPKLWMHIKHIRAKSQIGHHTVVLEKYIFNKILGFSKSPSDLSVVLIGSGQIMRGVLDHIKKYRWKKSVLVVRSPENYHQKEGEKNIEIVSVDKMKVYVRGADVVISATSCPNVIINRYDFEGEKKRLLIDLAMPRDMCGDLKKDKRFFYYDVDELIEGFETSSAEKKMAQRVAEIQVLRSAKELIDWFETLDTERQVMTWYNKKINLIQRRIIKQSRVSSLADRIANKKDERVWSLLRQWLEEDFFDLEENQKKLMTCLLEKAQEDHKIKSDVVKKSTGYENSIFKNALHSIRMGLKVYLRKHKQEMWHMFTRVSQQAG